MAWNMLLIVMVCAGCTYFLFTRAQKRIWKILLFLGVWFMGFVLTILVGLYVSTELYANDIAVMNRYFGSSILMPLAGCALGVFAKKITNAKNLKAPFVLFFLLCSIQPAHAGFVKVTNNFKVEDGVCYQEHVYDDKGSVWESFDCVERLKQEELIGHVYGQLVMYRDMKAQGLLSEKAYEHFFTEAIAIQQYYSEHITQIAYDQILERFVLAFKEAQQLYPNEKN